MTGETSHVGNWPGVTVELKVGYRKFRGRRICFVDLPGIYGLSGTSQDEAVARDFITSGEANLILALVDATAPERTLYLAIQVLELVPHVAIVFTKVDEAHPRGIHIHYDKLEEYLGVPVIPVSALRGDGIRELLELIVEHESRIKRSSPLTVNYGELEHFVQALAEKLEALGFRDRYPIRWVAVRLLEGDEDLLNRVRSVVGDGGFKEILTLIEEARNSLGRNLSEIVVRRRFAFVDSLTKKIIVRTFIRRKGKLETLLQRPITGLAISASIIFGVFLLIFSINTGFPLNLVFDLMGMKGVSTAIRSFSLSGLVSTGFNMLSQFAWETLLAAGTPHWLTSLISKGIILGVGSVLSFFPLILMVFLFLAVLEDSGLMPRMAVSFHTLLERFGLSGRAVYPLIISMGCNVPGVMTSRASIDEVERQCLIFSVPFIPCQARLVVGLAFTMALFTNAVMRAVAITFMYGIGGLAALLTALLIRRRVYRVREPPELLMELPPIHPPKAKVVWWLTWDNTKHFLRKAGLIIFSLSMVVWVLLYTGPQGYLPDIYGGEFFSHSFAAIIGNAVAPALQIFGFSHTQAWKLGFALVNGFVAKEIVLDSLSVLYGGANPVNAIRALHLTCAQGLAMLAFITLYLPCLATLAVMYQESRSLRKTIASLAYMMVLAYVVAVATYFTVMLVS